MGVCCALALAWRTLQGCRAGADGGWLCPLTDVPTITEPQSFSTTPLAGWMAVQVEHCMASYEVWCPDFDGDHGRSISVHAQQRYVRTSQGPEACLRRSAAAARPLQPQRCWRVEQNDWPACRQTGEVVGDLVPLPGPHHSTRPGMTSMLR